MLTYMHSLMAVESPSALNAIDVGIRVAVSGGLHMTSWNLAKNKLFFSSPQIFSDQR